VSASPAACSRIQSAHRWGAFYRGYLASHHPMAITALDAMGATSADLDRFEAHYLPNLEPLGEAVVTIEEGDEAAHLGSPRAYPEWVQYFTRAIERDGAVAVLERWVDRLVPALPAGAFHGAIRAAFALDSGAEGELARALAYWAAAYETLPTAPQPEGVHSPFEVLAALSRDPELAGRRPPGRNIIERTVAAARMPVFAEAVAGTDPRQLDLDGIARALLRAYAASGDFTLLHCVTGTHAFRLLSSFVAEPDLALRDLWAAAIAAHIGAGSPTVDGWGLKGSDALDWPEIHARAIRREDEHDIKLAYTCWREWQHRGDDLYRRAASARLT
jgi:hypothetical protein